MRSITLSGRRREVPTNHRQDKRARPESKQTDSTKAESSTRARAEKKKQSSTRAPGKSQGQKTEEGKHETGRKQSRDQGQKRHQGHVTNKGAAKRRELQVQADRGGQRGVQNSNTHEGMVGTNSTQAAPGADARLCNKTL